MSDIYIIIQQEKLLLEALIPCQVMLTPCRFKNSQNIQRKHASQ